MIFFFGDGKTIICNYVMGKAHKNCIIGKILCLRHIIGTTFITRMTLYVYIVEGIKTSQNIYILLYSLCKPFVFY